MPSEDIKNYVVNCLKKGFSKQAILIVTHNAGWSEEEVEKVFKDEEVKAILSKIGKTKGRDKAEDVDIEEKVSEEKTVGNDEEEKPKKTKEKEDNGKEKQEKETKKESTKEVIGDKEEKEDKEKEEKKTVEEKKIDPKLKKYILSHLKEGFRVKVVKFGATSEGWSEEDVEEAFKDKEIKAILSKNKMQNDEEEESEEVIETGEEEVEQKTESKDEQVDEEKSEEEESEKRKEREDDERKKERKEDKGEEEETKKESIDEMVEDEEVKENKKNKDEDKDEILNKEESLEEEQTEEEIDDIDIPPAPKPKSSEMKETEQGKDSKKKDKEEDVPLDVPPSPVSDSSQTEERVPKDKETEQKEDKEKSKGIFSFLRKKDNSSDVENEKEDISSAVKKSPPNKTRPSSEDTSDMTPEEIAVIEKKKIEQEQKLKQEIKKKEDLLKSVKQNLDIKDEDSESKDLELDKDLSIDEKKTFPVLNADGLDEEGVDFAEDEDVNKDVSEKVNDFDKEDVSDESEDLIKEEELGFKSDFVLSDEENLEARETEVPKKELTLEKINEDEVSDEKERKKEQDKDSVSEKEGTEDSKEHERSVFYTSLKNYVIEHLKAGFDEHEIKEEVLNAGWPGAEVSKVFKEQEVIEQLSLLESQSSEEVALGEDNFSEFSEPKTVDKEQSEIFDKEKPEIVDEEQEELDANEDLFNSEQDLSKDDKQFDVENFESSLKSYVIKRLKKGFDKEMVSFGASNAGWSEEEIKEVLEDKDVQILLSERENEENEKKDSPSEANEENDNSSEASEESDDVKTEEESKENEEKILEEEVDLNSQSESEVNEPVLEKSDDVKTEEESKENEEKILEEEVDLNSQSEFEVNEPVLEQSDDVNFDEKEEGGKKEEKVKEPNPLLRSYILSNLKKGFKSDAIKKTALEAGWLEENIDRVLGSEEAQEIVSESEKLLEEISSIEKSIKTRPSSDMTSVPSEDDSQFVEAGTVSKDTVEDDSQSKSPLSSQQSEQSKNLPLDHSSVEEPEEYINEPLSGGSTTSTVKTRPSSDATPIESNSENDFVQPDMAEESLRDESLEQPLENINLTDENRSTSEEKKSSKSSVNLVDIPDYSDLSLKETDEILESEPDLSDDESIEPAPNKFKKPETINGKVKRSVSNPASFFIEESYSASEFEDLKKGKDPKRDKMTFEEDDDYKPKSIMDAIKKKDERRYGIVD